MTIKEELELLRGLPLKEMVRPEDVPCRETSDRVQLCKHPVVTVRMLTYMHAKYIAQAIESVMMQQTDFEFELIISDDCSTDGTREIAEDYQRKYPDKIRVLWWTENQYDIGGNGARLSAAGRGEFFAFCEGDDYWLDPFKLQKQVDAMRTHPNVAMCFCCMKRFIQSTEQLLDDPRFDTLWPIGVIDGKKMALSDYVIPTPTCMMRASVLKKVCQTYDIMHWVLRMSDFQAFKLMALNGDVYCHHDRMAAYRIHGESAMHVFPAHIMRDSGLVMWYLSRITDIFPSTYGRDALERIGRYRMSIIAHADDVARKSMIVEFDNLVKTYPDLRRQIGFIPHALVSWGLGKQYDWYMFNRRRVLGRLRRGCLWVKRHLGLG